MIVKQHGGVLPWAAMPLTAGNDRKKGAALISQNRRRDMYVERTKTTCPATVFFFPRRAGQAVVVYWIKKPITTGDKTSCVTGSASERLAL